MRLAKIVSYYLPEYETNPTSSMHMIGVVLCSRGLVFSRVMEAINRELTGYNYKFFISHDLPIPDCQNEKTEEALVAGCESLLFVEEDVVIPFDGFRQLANLDSDIACIDYGVQGWGCVTRDKTNEILWCGLGCTLIKRRVFESLERPYFRSDKQLLLNFWPEIRWIDAPQNAYGGQDIWFCIHAREKGFNVRQVMNMECEHLRLEKLGTPEINKGIHTIVQKPKIEKFQII